jgi:ribosomal protein S27E
MAAVDGNAIGGLLLEVFGTDLTDAEATCATCGTTGPVAETVVYLDAPGTVVRCRNCSGLLMVISQIRGIRCVDLRGLEALDTRS